MRAIALAVALVIISGCGGTERTGKRSQSAKEALPRVKTTCAKGVNCASDSPRPVRKCTSAGRDFRTCATFFGSGYRPTIEKRAASEWAVVQGPLQASGTTVSGWWRRAFLSPDGDTLLAQWVGDCEIPRAFFLRASGGAPRAVTGEADWTTAPNSVAVGWRADGHAEVMLLGAACGIGAHRPGVYLVDPASGRATFVRKLGHRESGA
jgi:hypothetical protein